MFFSLDSSAADLTLRIESVKSKHSKGIIPAEKLLSEKLDFELCIQHIIESSFIERDLNKKSTIHFENIGSLKINEIISNALFPWSQSIKWKIETYCKMIKLIFSSET